MLFKSIIFILFLAIAASLLVGMRYLVKDQGKTKRTVNALTVRVVLSALLLGLLLLGAWQGWIRPHALPAAGQSYSSASQ